MIGTVYHGVDKATGECVWAGSTILSLEKRWANAPYYHGKGKYLGFCLVKFLEIKSREGETRNEFSTRLRKEAEHEVIVSGKFLSSGHPLSNKFDSAIQSQPDWPDVARLGGLAVTRKLHVKKDKEGRSVWAKKMSKKAHSLKDEKGRSKSAVKAAKARWVKYPNTHILSQRGNMWYKHLQYLTEGLVKLLQKRDFN